MPKFILEGPRPCRLRAVPLSLCPSCVTRKKTARKKRPREILEARSARKEGPSFRALLAPRISGGHFSFAVFFRVTHDGLSERGTTRSLTTMHNLLFCAHTLCMNYVTKTFLLVSSSVRSKQLLCFVHGQGNKKRTKTYNKEICRVS